MASDIKELVEKWGFWTTPASKRHAFEGFDLNEGNLSIRIWHEGRFEGVRGEALLCRIAHSLIYGHYRLRAKKEIPIETLFRSQSQIQNVSVIYFQLESNLSPKTPELYQYGNARKEEAKKMLQERLPRVLWNFSEKGQPYLKYSVSRTQWSTLRQMLPKDQSMSFERFSMQWCSNVLTIAPDLKTNLPELSPSKGSNRDP